MFQKEGNERTKERKNKLKHPYLTNHKLWVSRSITIKQINNKNKYIPKPGVKKLNNTNSRDILKAARLDRNCLQKSHRQAESRLPANDPRRY